MPVCWFEYSIFTHLITCLRHSLFLIFYLYIYLKILHFFHRFSAHTNTHTHIYTHTHITKHTAEELFCFFLLLTTWNWLNTGALKLCNTHVITNKNDNRTVFLIIECNKFEWTDYLSSATVALHFELSHIRIDFLTIQSTNAYFVFLTFKFSSNQQINRLSKQVENRFVFYAWKFDSSLRINMWDWLIFHTCKVCARTITRWQSNY